ncbi:MAG: ABC transporter permease [Vicinamibacterales bacterium]
MRLLSLLLRLFPPGLREERGAELLALIAAELAPRRGVGRLCGVALAAGDLAVNAVAAHLEVTRTDLGEVVRTIRTRPGFAGAVILVSALGISATTVAFSLADHVLVRALPFPEPERLVALWQDQTARGYARMELSPGNYEDWRRQSTAFTSMGAFTDLSVNAMTAGGPMRLESAWTTPSLFETLGVPAARGRTLVEGDESAAVPPVVVSDSFWRTVLGARADVLGTDLVLNGAAHTIVGVMPPAFDFPDRDIDVWTAMRFTAELLEDRSNVFLRAVARLRPEATRARAQAELDGIAAALARAYPEANDKTGAAVTDLREMVPRQTRILLLALVGASCGVLLIACANLASLLLARAAERQRELAVRLAMGARPRGLARQVLTEGLALSALGGLAGVALAAAIVPLTAALVPVTLPIAGAPALDWRMLAIAVAATLTTGVAFGLAPAIRLGRALRTADLRHGSRVFGTRATERTRSAFVIAQVAATVTLLVVVALFLQALWQVQQVDPGFRADGVLTARTELPVPAYEQTVKREQFYRRVLDDVRALPGVESAAYISFLPMVMRGGIWPMLTNSTTVPEDARMASVRFVTPGYFATMGVPLLQGRDVARTDAPGTPLVAVVSRTFAETHWPGRDPLGQHVDTPYTEPMTIVGVVGDVKVRGLERQSEPQIYFASAQMVDGGAIFYAPKDLVIRTTGPIEGLVPAIRRAVTAADPLQPITNIRPMTAIVEADTASRSVQVGVLGAFASLAVLLVLVGMYGLLSYVVAARTQEIGVRMALGASPTAVVRLVLTRTAALTAIGLAVGGGGAYAASRAFQALLAGVSPTSATAYAAAAGLALMITFGASAPAARRAARIDPLDAMRVE